MPVGAVLGAIDRSNKGGEAWVAAVVIKHCPGNGSGYGSVGGRAGKGVASVGGRRAWVWN